MTQCFICLQTVTHISTNRAQFHRSGSIFVVFECPTLQNAVSNHIDEDDPITFLLEKPALAINNLKDAGLSETSRMIKRHNKTTTGPSQKLHLTVFAKNG